MLFLSRNMALPINKKNVSITPLLIAGAISMHAMSAFATTATVTNTKVFQIELGASRIIYHPDSSGAEISVTNPQDYPILVQGKVTGEDKKSAAPFMVTPPLFRLEAHQQSRVRIISTGGSLSPDRETLQWLCVAGIPPKDGDAWAQGAEKSPKSAVMLNLEVSAHDCIKLINRPASVKGTVMDSASALRWSRQGSKLTVNNPTPFFINLSSVSVGGKAVEGVEYVAPDASRSFSLPANAAGPVQWTVITDEGGSSHPFHAELNQ